MKTEKTTKKEARAPEFAGATAIARRLGLSPSHVWRVATGRRRSMRLERELAACGAAKEGGAR